MHGQARGCGHHGSPGRHTPPHHVIVDVTVRHVVTPSAGAIAEAGEAGKFRRYRALQETQHRFVPFVIEGGGRVGPHAMAWMEELASRTVARAILRPGETRGQARGRILRSMREGVSLSLHAAVATFVHSRLVDGQERQRHLLGV